MGVTDDTPVEAEGEALPEFLADDEEDGAEQPEDEPQIIAAE
jgi:hypothetical protein